MVMGWVLDGVSKESRRGFWRERGGAMTTTNDIIH